MRMLGLAFQVVLSLGIVLGLMWLLARALRSRAMSSGAGMLEVLGRLPLTRGSSVAVVRVADQVLVLGVTETQVTVLTVADPELSSAATGREEGGKVQGRRSPRLPSLKIRNAGGGPLQGSILSPDSWQRAIALVRERTVRR